MLRPVSVRRSASAPPRTFSGALRAGRRLTSPRRVLAMVGSAMTLLTVARAVVLFVESYSAVRSERLADTDLMNLCVDGSAAHSVDFRALCIKKKAERASPVLLKALLRACSTAFADFCEVFSSWTKIGLLVLFCLTGIAAPVVKAVALLCTAHLRRRAARRHRAGSTPMVALPRAANADDSSDDDDEAEHDDRGARGLLTSITLDDGDEEDAFGQGRVWARPSMGALAAMGRLMRRRRAARRAVATLGGPLEEDGEYDDADDYGYANGGVGHAKRN